MERILNEYEIRRLLAEPFMYRLRVNQLFIRRLHCVKDFFFNDEMIFKCGQDYKLWVGKIDQNNTCCLVVIPQKLKQVENVKNSAFIVPLTHFKGDARTAPLAKIVTIDEVDYRYIMNPNQIGLLVNKNYFDRAWMTDYIKQLKGCENCVLYPRIFGYAPESLFICWEVNEEIAGKTVMSFFNLETDCYCETNMPPIRLKIGNGKGNSIFGSCEISANSQRINVVINHK